MNRLRLKHVCRLNTRTLTDSSDEDQEIRYCDVSSVERGHLFIPSDTVRFGDAPSRARRLAKAGDSVISTVRPYLKAVAHVPECDDVLVFSTAFAVLEPDPELINSRFLYWVLQSDPFTFEAARDSNGVSYPAITAEDLIRIKIDLPEPSQQERIVRFLDEHTAKIDQLVEKQQLLIGLVESREVLLRDTTFDRYVGEGDRLKYVLTERNDRFDQDDLGQVPLLSVSIHWGVLPRSESIGSESTADSFQNYKIVDIGNIVLNRMRAFQGAVGASTFSGVTSPDYAVFECRPTLLPEWLMCVMKSRHFVDEMILRLKGIGGTESGKVRTPRINAEDLLEIRITIPSIEEQQHDLRTYREALQKSTTLNEAAQRQIELALERRSALITAAVTGQIEV